jgi:hypothetical protein
MTEKQAPLSGLPRDPQSGCQEQKPGQETPEPVIQGSHLASYPSGGRYTVTSSGCPFREGRVPEGGGSVSQPSPLWTLLFEVSLLSTMVESLDIWSPSRGEFSKSHH